MVNSLIVICWTGLFVISGVSGLFYRFYSKILLVETVDPDLTPHYVASDMGLNYLPK